MDFLLSILEYSFVIHLASEKCEISHWCAPQWCQSSRTYTSWREISAWAWSNKGYSTTSNRGSKKIGGGQDDLRNQSGKKVTSNQSLGIQLPRIFLPRLPRILEPNTTMKAMQALRRSELNMLGTFSIGEQVFWNFFGQSDMFLDKTNLFWVYLI